MDRIIIGKNKFPTLVALTEEEQRRGLMFRDPPVPVMAFPFLQARPTKFWMKNTPAPLDIIFCNAGKVIDICEGIPFSDQLVGPDTESDLVVEFPAGSSFQYDIKPGDDVSLQYSFSTLAKRYDLITKLSSKDIMLYTFVPQDSIKAIKEHGILSSSLVIENEDILNIARPKKKDQKEFIERTQSLLESDDKEDNIIAEGVSSFFTLPDYSKLPKDHNIFKHKLVPIKINLSKLLKDHKDTILLGVELKPSSGPAREKIISLKDIENYVNKNPAYVWKNYEPISGMYAPNVPHLIIKTKMRKIPVKYLVI